MCMSRVILKWCSRELSELEYFRKHLHRNSTGHSDVRFATDIDVVGGERVVPLDPFSIVEIVIYKQPFTSQKAVLVELAETRFEKAEWAASLERRATKEQLLTEVSRKRVLEAHLSK